MNTETPVARRVTLAHEEKLVIDELFEPFIKNLLTLEVSFKSLATGTATLDEEVPNSLLLFFANRKWSEEFWSYEVT